MRVHARNKVTDVAMHKPASGVVSCDCCLHVSIAQCSRDSSAQTAIKTNAIWYWAQRHDHVHSAKSVSATR